jgi:hypothetical protein
VSWTVRAVGLEEHQYIAVRHSEQEQEHLHVAVNQIHPETLKVHHPYEAIPEYQALAKILEEELELRRVDPTRAHAQSHRARDFEAHQGLERFSGWARRTIGDAMELDRVNLLGRKDVARRLAGIAVDRGLEIAQERER